jgi:predicted Zn-ribbon and HTH transcriptional regulator
MKIRKDGPDDDWCKDYFITDSEGKLHLRVDKHSRGIWLGAFDKYILKLNDLYKTEADAKEEIVRRVDAIRPFQCTKCDGHEFYREYGETVGRCKACNTEVWLLAQTEFFAGIKRAKARLFIILLMENGLIFNTRQFAAALKVAYATAWNLNSKAKQALLDVLSACAEIETVDSAFFRQVFIGAVSLPQPTSIQLANKS